MSVLVIQENGRHDANRRFRECFCIQREIDAMGLRDPCEVWGLGHKNFARVPDFSKYDYIFCLENYDNGWVPHAEIAKCRGEKYLWSIDSHVTGVAKFRRAFEAGKYTKLLFSCKRDATESTDMWFPNCADRFLFRPNPMPRDIPIGFCGNYVTGQRKRLVKTFAECFGDKFKENIFVIGDAMLDVIWRTRLNLNLNISYDFNYRNFETTACGTALLTSFHPDMEELGFIDGKTCIVYKTVEEALDKAKFYLSVPDLTQKIADAGAELTHARHTYGRFRLFFGC